MSHSAISLSEPFVIFCKSVKVILNIQLVCPAAANKWVNLSKDLSIKISILFKCPTGETAPIVKPVTFLTSSAEAIDTSLMFNVFLILLREAFLSPAIKHKVNVFSVLKSKLLIMAPTSQPKDEAAWKAVLEGVFNEMIT